MEPDQERLTHEAKPKLGILLTESGEILLQDYQSTSAQRLHPQTGPLASRTFANNRSNRQRRQ